MAQPAAWSKASSAARRCSSPVAASATFVANGGNGNRSGQRGRDERLVEHHRAGQEARRALAQLGREEAVLGGLARVEPAGDLERRLADDRLGHPARRLLAADEQHAERAPALGDVDEQLLDRAVALARRVLVELVEHDEAQRLAARALLLLEDARDQRADDEALRRLVQSVDVDDGERSCVMRGSLHAAAHEVAEPRAERHQAAQEGHAACPACVAPRPRRTRRTRGRASRPGSRPGRTSRDHRAPGARGLGGRPARDDPLEGARVRVRLAGDHDRARLVLERVGVAGELHAHALLDEPDLGRAVVVLGEAEAQQALADEVLGRPAVDARPRGCGRDVDVGHDLVLVRRPRAAGRGTSTWPNGFGSLTPERAPSARARRR